MLTRKRKRYTLVIVFVLIFAVIIKSNRIVSAFFIHHSQFILT